MGDYRKYFGCCAICSNGNVIGFEDLYSANEFSDIVTIARCDDCGCPMDYNARWDYYKCKSCGQKVSYSDVMSAMDADNKKWEDDYLREYDNLY